MLKIEKVVLPSAEQWAAIIRGMRNPKNSWELSDSGNCSFINNCDECDYYVDSECINPIEGTDARYRFVVGTADQKLMMSLAKGGPVHAKYRRMIPVFMDITAPLYW